MSIGQRLMALQLGGQTGYAAEPVDIWGMGVVLFTMLVGSKRDIHLFEAFLLILW